jgi:uncharacterized protein (DUF433 family)
MSAEARVTGARRDLIERYIEPDPHRPDDARLREHGVSVWTLVGYWRDVAGEDVERVAEDYEVPVDAVRAALAFYENNRTLIDARLALNTT